MKPTLALIPGWGGNELLWEPIVQLISDIVTCQVLVLNQQTSRNQMVDYVLKSSPTQFILADQSMGRWVAIKIAAQAPERFSKLILVNTWASPDPKLNEIQKDLLRDLKNEEVDQAISRHLLFILHPESLNNFKLGTELLALFEHSKTKTLIDHMQAMLDDYVFLPLLSKIAAPTPTIHRREDQLFPTSEQEFIRKHIKGSELTVIEKCGHCSPIEHPEKMATLIHQFLTRRS